MNFLLSLTLGSLLFTQSYGNFWRYSSWGCCLVNTVHFLYRLVAVEDYLSVLMLWLIISRCATSSTVNHAWERLCGCKPHPSGAASRLNKLQLQFDPDLGGSASWINNVCISSGRKLNYLTLKATMERVTGCFLRGHAAYLCCVEVREGGRGGQTEGCCCCIWMRAREIPLCPSPPHFTLCKTASHPLFLPHSSLFWPTPDTADMSIRAPDSLPVWSGFMCACACRSLRLIRVESSHLFSRVTLILLCLLALLLCVLTRHFSCQKKKRSWAKLN